MITSTHPLMIAAHFTARFIFHSPIVFDRQPNFGKKILNSKCNLRSAEKNERIDLTRKKSGHRQIDLWHQTL